MEHNARTEKHLLWPDDVLITARSTALKAALVPPALTRAVADATLLVVRASEIGLGPYLWWFLTADHGRRQVQSRMTGSTTFALSASNLVEMVVPRPDLRMVDRIADLVELSERAYVAAIEAARLRRTLYRDLIIERLGQGDPSTPPAAFSPAGLIVIHISSDVKGRRAGGGGAAGRGSLSPARPGLPPAP